MQWKISRAITRPNWGDHLQVNQCHIHFLPVSWANVQILAEWIYCALRSPPVRCTASLLYLRWRNRTDGNLICLAAVWFQWWRRQEVEVVGAWRCMWAGCPWREVCNYKENCKNIVIWTKRTMESFHLFLDGIGIILGLAVADCW